MTPNTNASTGIAFGYISGHRAMELVNEIQTHGDSLTYAAYKDYVRDELRRALDKASTLPDDEAERALKDDLQDFVRHRQVERVLKVAFESGFDFDEAFSAIEDHFGDNYEPDEEVHSLMDSAYHYTTSWLGGALNICIMKSPFVTFCHPCSICVPGAGDLDRMCEEDDGQIAYCVNPDDIENIEDKPFVVLDADSHEVVWTRESGWIRRKP